MQEQDFKITNGDIVIEDNDIKMISGRDIYIQAFRLILSTRLGEYFLNINEGLDFFALLGQKEINDDIVNDALQAAGVQVRDFVKFNVLNWSFNHKTRTLIIFFEALFEDGYQLQFEEEVSLDG